MAIPSQVRQCRKGVETSWQTSHVEEGIVQTTNPKGVAKAVVVRITDWSMVQVHPGPPKSSHHKWEFFIDKNNNNLLINDKVCVIIHLTIIERLYEKRINTFSKGSHHTDWC